MTRLGKVKRDLVGKQIGCWTVLDEYKRVQVDKGTKILWKCKCKCGNEEFIYRDSLLNNKHEYCDKCKPVGIRNEKLYHVYYGIKARCNDKNNPSYHKYGGKGILMCKDWEDSFETFKKWAYKNGYSEKSGLTIDRVDPSLGYFPHNCRWITLSENSARANRGRHKNHMKLTDVYAISPEGERVEIDNVCKFCRDYSLNRSNVNAALHGRINNKHNGWIFHSNKTRY